MAMARFVALRRGVDVGKGKRQPMAAFESLLEGQGCTGVQTLLDRGSAVFSAAGGTAAANGARIAEALCTVLGRQPRVVAKTAADLAALLDTAPVRPGVGQHSALLVAVAADEAAPHALKSLRAQPPGQPAVTAQGAYLNRPGFQGGRLV